MQKEIEDGEIAQLVEHRVDNAVVAGSSPALTTSFMFYRDRSSV